MNNLSTDPVSRYRPADGWRTRRIWIAGAFGATFPASQRILDFWPLGAGGSLGHAWRALFDLSRVPLMLPLAGLAVGLLIAAGIALWRRQGRRMASSIFAIAAISFCMVVVADVPLFDPWLWYALANRTRFEALAASAPLRTDRNTRCSKPWTFQQAWLASTLIISYFSFTVKAMPSVLSRPSGLASGGPEPSTPSATHHLPSPEVDDCTAISSGWTISNSTEAEFSAATVGHAVSIASGPKPVGQIRA